VFLSQQCSEATQIKIHEEENASASKSDFVPPNIKEQETGQSVMALSVNSEHLDNMIQVVNVVQQIMTELKAVVSEQSKTANRVHWPLKITAFNANGIWRQ
jgi:hypothetical protein